MSWFSFARAPAALAPASAPAAPVRTPAARPSKRAAAMALAVSLVGGFEGLRQTAYPDPATGREPWTVCYGETAGVRPGDHHSLAECKAMLAASLAGYAARLEACVTRPMPDPVYAAFLSLSYNIGSGAFCRSSVARDWNAGREHDACDDILRFNRAAGIVFPGLTRRRVAERALCLPGDD